MKTVFTLLVFLSLPAFADNNRCVYDGTTYHLNDFFMAKDQCNSCDCSFLEGYGTAVGCTEVGCINHKKEKKDFRPFQRAAKIKCQKKNTQTGLTWDITFSAQGRRGQYQVTAIRNNEYLYHPSYQQLQLVLQAYSYQDRIRLVSPNSTVFFDLTRPYGGKKATGYFSSQRYGRQVSNLQCYPQSYK